MAKHDGKFKVSNKMKLNAFEQQYQTSNKLREESKVQAKQVARDKVAMGIEAKLLGKVYLVRDSATLNRIKSSLITALAKKGIQYA